MGKMSNFDNNTSEIISRIEKLGGEYDPESNLSIQDQLLICQSIAESTPVNPEDWDGKTILQLKQISHGDGNVHGSVNGSCKRRINFELTENKYRAISQLNDFTCQATPLVIEQCLTEIFSDYPSIEGWWLYVGQHWTQRVINWVLKHVLKLQETGRITKNPAACFTYIIRHRKKRRSL